MKISYDKLFKEFNQLKEKYNHASEESDFEQISKENKHIEDNDYRYKFGENFQLDEDSFCFTKSKNDETLKTEDFSMLTTLPRLFGTTDSGRCYIKPSKRGTVNSTMKYIRIFCKKLTDNPILVITSD